MKYIKSSLVSTTALVLALTFTASVPAFAMSASTNGGSDASGQNTSTAAEHAKREDQAAHLAEQRQQAAAKLQQARAEHKAALTADQKQKICQVHKHGIDTKIKRILSSSQRAQKRIDEVFAKAQAYQKAKNLQPANYDDLVASAQSAKTASSDSVAALKTAVPSIDCSSGKAATQATAFKTAAQDTHTKLKAYRAAVKAVLESLKTAKTAGGQQ